MLEFLGNDGSMTETESFDTGSFWKQMDFQPSSITSVVEINDRIFD